MNSDYQKDSTGRRVFPGTLILKDIKIGGTYYDCHCGSRYIDEFVVLDVFKYQGDCKHLKNSTVLEIRYTKNNVETNVFAGDVSA